MKRFIPKLLTSALLTIACQSAVAATPNNVILIIGDGMDDHQITIARNYLVGAQGRLSIDNLPVRSASQVLTVDNDDPQKPVYVADSANSGTSLATGQVTSRGRIATAAKTDKDIVTIVELAQRAGLRTGIVTTASVTDATPAAFYAHIDKRFCDNPAMMVDGMLLDRFKVNCKADTKANGGLGSISEQLADSDIDIVLGGGMKNFNVAAEGVYETVLEQAKNNGFTVLTQPNELEVITGEGKVLGLFAEKTLPTRLQGENGRIAEAPERSWLNYIHHYLGSITLPPVMTCESNPDYAAVPSLKMMTDAAIKQLDYNNDRGFLLVIESASIDKQSHRRNACGSIGEVEQLNEAVDSAMAFAENSPNTLVMVTADHGQAAQLIPQISMFTNKTMGNLPIASPGLVSRIITPEGGILGINYATNEAFLEEHSGVNVPLFANEVGKPLIAPLVREPDIFKITKEYLGLYQ